MELDIQAELDRVGAVLLDRHFVYKSGKHGSGYINMDPLFPYTDTVARICTALAQPFAKQGVATIAAPATGGIILAAGVARSYEWKGSSRMCVWADKNGDEFVFERAGFAEHVVGKKVLVVEDLLTTGGSVLKVCEQIKQLGGDIVGVSAVCNRGGITAEDLGVPRLETLLQVNFEAIPAEDCPLCKQNVPIVEDIGHGAEYAQAHPDYKGGYVKLLN